MISKKHEVIFAIKLRRFVGFLQLFIHRIVNIGKDLQGHVVQRYYYLNSTPHLSYCLNSTQELLWLGLLLG